MSINTNIKCINVEEIENEDNELNTQLESYGDKEYALCLKKALKEAIEENEKVRNYFVRKYLFYIFI